MRHRGCVEMTGKGCFRSFLHPILLRFVCCTVVLQLGLVVGCSQSQQGKSQAKHDWKNQGCVIWTSEDEGARVSVHAGYSVSLYYDEETGLPFRWKPAAGPAAQAEEFYEGYNETVHELIRTYGLPSWSIKKYLLPATDIVRMFNCQEFTVVRAFAYEVNSNIVLLKGGELSRWGQVFRDTSHELSCPFLNPRPLAEDPESFERSGVEETLKKE